MLRNFRNQAGGRWGRKYDADESFAEFVANHADCFKLGFGKRLRHCHDGSASPHTGHVPRYGVPIMLGIPGFIFGLLVGAALGCLVVAAHETHKTRLGERMLLGAAIGGFAGRTIRQLFAQSELTLVVAVINGHGLQRS